MLVLHSNPSDTLKFIFNRFTKRSKNINFLKFFLTKHNNLTYSILMEDKRNTVIDFNEYYEMPRPFLVYKCTPEPKTLLSRWKPF